MNNAHWFGISIGYLNGGITGAAVGVLIACCVTVVANVCETIANNYGV